MDTSPQSATLPRTVHRYRDGKEQNLEDILVVEEPLEIRLDGRRYTATMRTPGDDLLLAQGLLFTEGVIHSLDDIEHIETRFRCREKSQDLVNVLDVRLHDAGAIPTNLWERSLISNSSCGLCGKASVEAFTAVTTPLPAVPLPLEILPSLPELLREHQPLFEQTGGLHAAALFRAGGTFLTAFEDIGRHNATDKVIGWALEKGLVPAAEPLVLLVSGRASFEIIQKALVARIATVAAVSAASSLAVELAAANGLNLVGFLRERGFTVYVENNASD